MYQHIFIIFVVEHLFFIKLLYNFNFSKRTIACILSNRIDTQNQYNIFRPFVPQILNIFLKFILFIKHALSPKAPNDFAGKLVV